ncbi:MAG: hypothetical protein AAB646_02680 [Patescibacteria group bacterium]
MRFLKQLLYGLFYLLILSGITYGGYLAVSKPVQSCFDNIKNQNEEDVDCGGECIACALKNIQSIKSSAYFLTLDGINNAVITLENPNIEYGAKDFVYTLEVYKSIIVPRPGEKTGLVKEVLFSLARDSFIYPGERKVIIEPNLKFDTKQIIGNPVIIISNPIWVPASEFTKPDVRVKTTETLIVKQQAEIRGVISNLESFGLGKTVVNVMVQDSDIYPIGVTKTVFSNLKPFEERIFKISTPLFKTPKGKTSVLFWTEALK